MGRGQRRNRSHKKVKIDNNDDDDNQTVYGSSSTSITAAAEKEEDPPLPTTTTPIAATKPTAHPQQQPSNPTTTSPPYLDVTYWKGTTTSASDVCSSGSSSSFGDDIPKSLTAEQFYCDTTTDDDDDKHTPNHPPTVHHSITTDDAWTSLFSLWHSLPLHQNHNRFHNTNRNTSIPIHDPTPIQLQAWAILLPLGQQQQDRGGSTSMADVPNAPPPTIRITTTNTTTNVKKTNLVQISPTGSGKTFAYGLPLIVESAAAHCRLKKPSSSTARRMTGLVLVPTRELARQVQSTLQSAIRAWSSASAPRLDNSNAASRNSSSRTEVSVVAWYGGVEKRAQLQEFRTMLVNHNGGGSRSSSAIVGGGSAVIVAATTGRFLDLLQHIFGHVSDSDRAALAPQSQISSSSSSSSSSRVALDDERKNMQKQLSSNLMTIVLDEADRLAINKDLFEQTSKILQYLRAPSSTSGNQHDIHSQEEANNNSNSSSRVDIRMVLCSATWPDRATQPWNEWVDAPCISIKVDAVRVHSAARSSSSAVADTVGIEASLKVEDVNAQESYKRRDLLLSRIPSNLTQVLHVCAEHKKPKKLVSTLEAIHQSNTDKRNRSLGIVFFATIKTLQYISTLLMKEKALQCTQLHSSLNQSSRDQAVRDFTSGKIPILLATDIAARGIHIPNVLFVINYDFPTNLEQYVHRCGRAGRGISNNIEETVTTSRETGKIYSFFTRNLAPMAEDLIALLESNQQWIDPNLRLLIRKSSSSSKHAQKKREISDTGDARASNETVAKSSHNETNQDNSEGDDDPFVALSANRIVLKRALHVSDASENEDDSEEEC